MTRVMVSALAALLVLAPAPHAQAAGATITMPEKSGQYTINWSGQADQIHIRWLPYAIGGEMYLCGTYALKGHGMSSTSRRVLRDIAFKVDGKTVLRNVSYFTPAASPDALVGAKAACKGTGRPVPRGSGHSYRLGVSKTVYNN